MKIILDAMGSDQYPGPELQAAITASRDYGEEIILVGNATILEPKLEAMDTAGSNIQIVHAPDVLEMTDHPVEATKKKPDNSMAVGLRLHKEGKGEAFVTAGNTGAAAFNAIRVLTRIKGISRPALATAIPTRKGKCVFIDTGVNVDCRPEHLGEFAIMASVYAEKVLKIKNPRISLLSNGEEDIKGNQLVKDANPLLKKLDLNFVGNVEPKEVFAGEVDVVVSDGFPGNIFIKTSEAVAKFITDILREEISASTTAKLGYLLAKPAFAKLKTMMDPAEVGAAMLLGVEGYAFIGHGRSDAHALVSATQQAHQAVEAHLLESLKASILERITLLDALRSSN
ncbi:MAG: phosphate acyltransferase PlsX [Anaerolineaceae bacterium]|jgi:glycerol-3-phosphate acyltransferase PlsX